MFDDFDTKIQPEEILGDDYLEWVASLEVIYDEEEKEV